MALFNNWLQRKPRENAAEGADSAEPRQNGANQGNLLGAAQEQAKDNSRKTQRSQRREVLYAMIREHMIRIGALSTAYRFRVLSMDAGGREYVVMVDLAADLFEQPQRLADFERTIAELARTRHELEVTAIYWRVSDELTKATPRTQPMASTRSSQADKLRQELQHLKEEGEAPRASSATQQDFQATQMIDSLQSEGPVSDFAATQMIDFSQLDESRDKRRG